MEPSNGFRALDVLKLIVNDDGALDHPQATKHQVTFQSYGSYLYLGSLCRAFQHRLWPSAFASRPLVVDRLGEVADNEMYCGIWRHSKSM